MRRRTLRVTPRASSLAGERVSPGRVHEPTLVPGPQANSGRVAFLSQPTRSRNSRERCTSSAAASASYDGSELSANRCWSPG